MSSRNGRVYRCRASDFGLRLRFNAKLRRVLAAITGCASLTGGLFVLKIGISQPSSTGVLLLGASLFAAGFVTLSLAVKDLWLREYLIRRQPRPAYPQKRRRYTEGAAELRVRAVSTHSPSSGYFFRADTQTHISSTTSEPASNLGRR